MSYVERGAEVLDRVYPGWWRKIDLDRLDMKDCSDCLLGQLYGDYRSGLVKIGLPERPIWESIEWGFDADVITLVEDPNFSILRNAWVREISSRKAGESL
mgnify:FL=1